MFKTKLFIFGLSAFSIFLIFACEQSAEPKIETPLDYNSALIRSFDDEIQLIYDNRSDLNKGDVMFSLSWGRINAPVWDLALEIGHAMAVAFDGQESKRGYFYFGGLDMGAVTLEMPSDTVELNGINGHGGSYVYLSTPKLEGRGRHGFDNFNFSMVPFEASSPYIFKATGSDEFEAITVGLTTPETLISLSSLTDGQKIAPDEDLVIEWQGASAESHILIALLPFHNPNGRPGNIGPRDRKKVRYDYGKNIEFIRLDFQNHPVIVKKLDSNNGAYTITAEELKELVESIDAKSLMLHLSAIELSSEEIDSKLVNKMIRMTDRVILEIE